MDNVMKRAYKGLYFVSLFLLMWHRNRKSEKFQGVKAGCVPDTRKLKERTGNEIRQIFKSFQTD